MMQTLAKTPIKYEDFVVSDGVRFVDDLSQLPSATFRDTTVSCPCHASNKPFRNKQTFKTHLASKKHKGWLQGLSEKHDVIIRESLDRQKEIKNLRIRLEKLERKHKRAEQDAANHDKEKREILDEKQAIIEELEAERDGLKEAHELEKKKVAGLRTRLQEWTVWFKTGAEEIMDWTIPEEEEE
jgi:hypothetical protein